MFNSPESMLATVLGLLCSTVPAHVHAPNIPLALRNVSEAQWQKELLSFMPEITNRSANSHPPLDPSVLHGHIESSAWLCALEHNTYLCVQGWCHPTGHVKEALEECSGYPKTKKEKESWELGKPELLSAEGFPRLEQMCLDGSPTIPFGSLLPSSCKSKHQRRQEPTSYMAHLKRRGRKKLKEVWRPNKEEDSCKAGVLKELQGYKATKNGTLKGLQGKGLQGTVETSRNHLVVNTDNFLTICRTVSSCPGFWYPVKELQRGKGSWEGQREKERQENIAAKNRFVPEVSRN